MQLELETTLQHTLQRRALQRVLQLKLQSGLQLELQRPALQLELQLGLQLKLETTLQPVGLNGSGQGGGGQVAGYLSTACGLGGGWKVVDLPGAPTVQCSYPCRTGE